MGGEPGATRPAKTTRRNPTMKTLGGTRPAPTVMARMRELRQAPTARASNLALPARVTHRRMQERAPRMRWIGTGARRTRQAGLRSQPGRRVSPTRASGDRAGSSQAAAGAGASSAPDPRDLVETESVTLPEEPVDREIADSSDPADAPNPGHTGTVSSAALDPAARSPEALEREQALEAQLRRVPDDPGGLLRQRFLLQHLRREGRLP
jgi:hypothetical protein